MSMKKKFVICGLVITFITSIIIIYAIVNAVPRNILIAEIQDSKVTFFGIQGLSGNVSNMTVDVPDDYVFIRKMNDNNTKSAGILILPASTLSGIHAVSSPKLRFGFTRSDEQLNFVASNHKRNGNPNTLTILIPTSMTLDDLIINARGLFLDPDIDVGQVDTEIQYTLSEPD